MGAGFIVTPEKARALGLGSRPGLEAHIRDYRNGRDLLQRPRGVMVIDLFGLSEQEVMERFPEVYQHVLIKVKPERDSNNRSSYRDLWWIFGEPRKELRAATSGLSRTIGIVETSTHRIFQLLPVELQSDNKIIVIADDDIATFGVLQSRVHTDWAIEAGGWLGFGNDPVYVKGKVFDPFPFPDRSEAVAEIAERLDTARRAALAENSALTMTGLYNFVAAIRSGALPPEQEAAAVKARARIVAKLHDDLDQAVAEAYGWGEEWRRAPLPPAEIVRRLVALNAERAAEEAKGHVRWLRPDYQVPKFAKGDDKA